MNRKRKVIKNEYSTNNEAGSKNAKRITKNSRRVI